MTVFGEHISHAKEAIFFIKIPSGKFFIMATDLPKGASYIAMLGASVFCLLDYGSRICIIIIQVMITHFNSPFIPTYI